MPTPTPNEAMMENSVEKRDDQRIKPIFVPEIRLFIQGKVHDLVNISDSGFGILIETPTDFHLGQRIDDIFSFSCFQSFFRFSCFEKK